MKPIGYFTFLLFLLSSCSGPEKGSGLPSGHTFKDELNIDVSMTKSIELDSLTPTLTNYITMFDNDDAEQLVMLNHIENSLIFYDYASGKIQSKLVLPKDGPNGIGEIDSFEIVGQDSILMVSGSIYAGWYNREGKLLHKTERVDMNVKLTPLTSTSNPPVIRDGQLYQSGFFFGSRDHNTVLVCSLKKDSCHTLYRLPQIYREDFWGPGEYEMHFHTYNKVKNVFLYSFPPSNYVFATNHRDMSESYYAGSKYFDKIKAISSKQINSFEKVMDLTLIRPIYQEIMYDKYRDIYYRIAEHPLTEAQAQALPDQYAPGVRDFSIIVLNSDFEKVGESDIIDKGLYDSRILFVSKEGLHLKKLDRESEDLMRFDVFSVKSTSL